MPSIAPTRPGDIQRRNSSSCYSRSRSATPSELWRICIVSFVTSAAPHHPMNDAPSPHRHPAQKNVPTPTADPHALRILDHVGKGDPTPEQPFHHPSFPHSPETRGGHVEFYLLVYALVVYEEPRVWRWGIPDRVGYVCTLR